MSTSSNPTVQRLILTRGLPASGKTTWAKEQIVQSNGTAVRANRDDIRMNNFGKTLLDAAGESMVTKIQEDMIYTLLAGKFAKVIIDDTNLNIRSINNFRRIAQEFQGRVQVEIMDFPVLLKILIARDAVREKSVGADVINMIAKRYGISANGTLPTLPSRVYGRVTASAITEDAPIENDERPSAYVFDMDGTLAKFDGRSPFDWSAVESDHVNIPVAEMARMVRVAGHKVVIVTGRDGVAKDATQRWLNAHGIEFDDFYIRAEGDSRKDNVFKQEVLDEHLFVKYNIRGIFDDRDQVVAMWRANGFLCMQVDYGRF